MLSEAPDDLWMIIVIYLQFMYFMLIIYKLLLIIITIITETILFACASSGIILVSCRASLVFPERSIPSILDQLINAV